MARYGNTVVPTLAVFLVALGVTSAMAARAPNPEADSQPLDRTAVYDALTKLPDWAGAWEWNASPSVMETNALVPLNAKYAPRLAELRRAYKTKGELPQNTLCKPAGMPLFMAQRGPLFDIQFAPGRVLFLSGSYESRIIYTDGRNARQPDLTAVDGTSNGHWEGDALVIDTVDIAPESDVIPGIQNSGNLVIHERLTLVAPDKLEDTITLTDPSMFAKPWTYKQTFSRHRDWDVDEYVCLYDKGIDYAVGPKPTDEEFAASTTLKPPVRQHAFPAANANSLPGGSWASIAKLPDWIGKSTLWTMDSRPSEHNTNEYIPLMPVFAKKLSELRVISNDGGDIPTNNYHCWPRGVVQEMKGALARFFFVFTPGLVTLVPENAEIERFYTDGRTHPDTIELSAYGHAVGHWDDDKLIVDMVGFRPDVQLMNGMPSGGKLHILETFRATTPNRMRVDTALDSPVSLAEPWKYSRTFTAHPNYVVVHNYCSQNNRDIDPLTGNQQFDLTPPQ